MLFRVSFSFPVLPLLAQLFLAVRFFSDRFSSSSLHDLPRSSFFSFSFPIQLFPPKTFHDCRQRIRVQERKRQRRRGGSHETEMIVAVSSSLSQSPTKLSRVTPVADSGGEILSATIRAIISSGQLRFSVRVSLTLERMTVRVTTMRLFDALTRVYRLVSCAECNFPVENCQNLSCSAIDKTKRGCFNKRAAGKLLRYKAM